MIDEFRLGISKEFPCNYIPGNQERLLIVVDKLHGQANRYDYLMHQGFRRSGEQVYRPFCTSCQACQSIKVMVQEFTPSKSQKRSLKKNQHLRLEQSRTPKEAYYPLFERYINTLHSDGAMYPASPEQYQSFLFTHVCQQYFIELYDGDKLISVAVTDELPSALSAVYTFYDPNYRKSGLGIYSILQQIHVARALGKEFLYLGYQIDDCQKMNYKTKFYPYQRLYNNQWHIVPSQG